MRSAQGLSLASVCGCSALPPSDWRPERVCRNVSDGTVSERPKVHVSKTCVLERAPWVQIPPVPPSCSPSLPCVYGDVGGFVLLKNRAGPAKTPHLLFLALR